MTQCHVSATFPVCLHSFFCLLRAWSFANLTFRIVQRLFSNCTRLSALFMLCCLLTVLYCVASSRHLSSASLWRIAFSLSSASFTLITRKRYAPTAPKSVQRLCGTCCLTCVKFCSQTKKIVQSYVVTTTRQQIENGAAVTLHSNASYTKTSHSYRNYVQSKSRQKVH